MATLEHKLFNTALKHKLIQSVKKRKIIYDKKTKGFKRGELFDAWRAVSEELNRSRELIFINYLNKLFTSHDCLAVECKAMWKSLKDGYRYHVHKSKSRTTSDLEDTTSERDEWEFLAAMSFTAPTKRQ